MTSLSTGGVSPTGAQCRFAAGNKLFQRLELVCIQHRNQEQRLVSAANGPIEQSTEQHVAPAATATGDSVAANRVRSRWSEGDGVIQAN